MPGNRRRPVASLFDRIEKRAAGGGAIRREHLGSLVPLIESHTDPHGAATPELKDALLRLERVASTRFTPGARAAFQQIVARTGSRMRGPIHLPEDRVPYWQLGSHPLAGFQSAHRLPARADVVILGAGLTGASAALHLVREAGKGLKVVVLEHGDPASQASGRNGGNFELMPENFLGEYQGLPMERRKWLGRRYPWLSADRLADLADRQARLILQFGSRNAARFLEIVEREEIDCDLSTGGWLRIASTPEEERGIRAEVEFAARIGIRLELWTPSRIAKETGIPAQHLGRKALANGNYHPFKFVCGIFERVTRRGIQLFTRTPATAIRSTRGGLIQVDTPQGRLTTRKVIFATNAFTSTLLPELGAIRYYQSQILNLEHVRDSVKGMTVTENKGDLYYNFPRARKYTDPSGMARGMLLVGGGLDRPGGNPFELRRSAKVLDLVLSQTDQRFPDTRGQPPSRVWTGPMAFTPDRVPAIGFLRREAFPASSLIVAAGFNGYGGTYCMEAGRLAARMATTGITPDEVPEDMFSPNRFLTRRPLFE